MVAFGVRRRAGGIAEPRWPSFSSSSGNPSAVRGSAAMGPNATRASVRSPAPRSEEAPPARPGEIIKSFTTRVSANIAATISRFRSLVSSVW
jgi:hypothetical protein